MHKVQLNPDVVASAIERRGARHAFADLDPRTTALLVVDLQCAYLDETLNNSFCRDALDGRDLVLLSDGSPTRTFCYVSDAITGYYRALLRGRPGEAYNIGADSPEISMLKLAETVAGFANDLSDHEVKVVKGQSSETDYLVDNPNRRCPDITKAKRELQYRPRVTLEEGLKRTLLWYRGNRGGEER